MDEKGYWAQARQSVQMSSTQDRFSLSLTVPAGAVKDLSEFISTGGAPRGADGHRGRGGHPQLHEVPGPLDAERGGDPTSESAYTAQRVYFQEKDRWGRSFEEIGFAPEKGRRYTYCMGKQCLPCDGAGCKVAPPPSPCQGLTSVGRRLGTGSPSARTATWTRMTPGMCGSSTRAASRRT